VEITVFEKEDGSQMVTHLVNYQPEIGKNFFDQRRLDNMGWETRHLVQEILPVYNLELVVRDSRKVKKVELQPEGKDLKYRQENGEVLIEIPQLDCHSMVIIYF
jgi:hypothetical protein